MRRFAVVTVVILLAALPARGEPYQVAYEGDVFPEEDGWERLQTGGGADRTIQDGVLILSSDDPAVSDVYLLDRQEQLDAGPGEVFFAEWRMRVHPTSGIADVDVFIAKDGASADVNMGWSPDHFWSFNDFNNFPIDATQFHIYRLWSWNMIDYDFFIDGQYAYTGFFDPPGVASSWVIFGDCCIGQASTSEWDYFRFGVVRLTDITEDGETNLLDFATFAICFGGSIVAPNTGCSEIDVRRADFNRSGVIELNDFATFAIQFGT